METFSNQQSGVDSKKVEAADAGGKTFGDQGEATAGGDSKACGGCNDHEKCLDGECLCVPDCDGASSAPDGCGGFCSCPEGLLSNSSYACVLPSDCKETCESARWSCGSICGEDCGDTKEGTQCLFGRFECRPKCDGSRCEDGCGGTCPCGKDKVCNADGDCVDPGACTSSCRDDWDCGAVCGQPCGEESCGTGASCVDNVCKDAANCADCSIAMYVIDRTIVGEKIKQIKLAVDYQPKEGEDRARLMDLRIRADRFVDLTHVKQGPALVDSGKELFADPHSGQTWQRWPDGSIRLVAMSMTNTTELQPGRLLELTFECDESGPVRFNLVKRAQILAPPKADYALQGTDFNAEVVVSR